ncbi:putative DNA binding protein [Mycobacteroides abscessus subsp. abscessus]|nr:putative DNA binding protein [Mycobacteroides abscessus subsp. abscessus]SKV14673.1 putative DNA binding protein [Mycobacteroides abscessus subsp. abscessus]
MESNLTWTQLSERLESIEWKLTPVAIRNIESEERRVNVDDLVALSVALGVSPATLLMPDIENAQGRDKLKVTGVDDPVEAHPLWIWLTGCGPLPGRNATGYVMRSQPRWVRDNVEQANRQMTAFLAQGTAENRGDDK